MGAIITIGKSQLPSAPLQGEAADLILGRDREPLLELALRIEGVAERIGKMAVETDAEAAQIQDLLAAAKDAADKLEKDRKERKEPILREGRTLDALYKPAGEAFAALDRAVKLKLKEFINRKNEENARRLAEAARLQEEARKLEEAGDPNATQAMIEARRARPVEPLTTGIQSNDARSTVGFKKRVKITNLKDVPREYLEEAIKEEEEKAARQAERTGDTVNGPLTRVLLKMYGLGVQYIPGAALYEDDVIRILRGM